MNDKNIVKKKIGERFKFYRESIGQSEKDLAGILGISVATVRNIELGKSFLSVPCFFLLSKMGVSLNWLIGGEESKNPVQASPLNVVELFPDEQKSI